MSENRHFNVVVAGDNPEQLMAPFDSNLKVPPFVIYEYSKVEEYKKTYIDYYYGVAESFAGNEEMRQEWEGIAETYRGMNNDDFFAEITNGYEIDSKTGNAISTENLQGKYISHQVAHNFAMPLITKDGKEVYSARKSEIDWKKTHLANQKPYEIAWDTVMGGKKPKTDEEKNIYENMKNRTVYFETFGTRENYIASSTAFWGYAFLDNNGWHEPEDTVPQFEWVNSFYDRFIVPLPDDALITLYECTRND